MKTALFALALTASTLLSAPVPSPRPRQVTAGDYSLSLCGTWSVTLSQDGSYRARNIEGSVFVGSWQWDTTTRTLTIHERYKRDVEPRWIHWVIVLDAKLAGKTDRGTAVQLQRIP